MFFREDTTWKPTLEMLQDIPSGITSVNSSDNKTFAC